MKLNTLETDVVLHLVASPHRSGFSFSSQFQDLEKYYNNNNSNNNKNNNYCY